VGDGIPQVLINAVIVQVRISTQLSPWGGYCEDLSDFPTNQELRRDLTFSDGSNNVRSVRIRRQELSAGFYHFNHNRQ